MVLTLHCKTQHPNTIHTAQYVVIDIVPSFCSFRFVRWFVTKQSCMCLNIVSPFKKFRHFFFKQVQIACFIFITGKEPVIVVKT